MKSLFKISLSLLAAAMLFSCNDKEELPVYLQTMATVHSSDGQLDYFSSDIGVALHPQEDLYWTDSIKDGGRILLYFYTKDDTSLPDWEINVTAYKEVLVQNLTQFESSDRDTLDNQPLNDMYSAWIGNDYMNILFTNYVSSAQKAQKFELVRVKDKDRTQPGQWPLVCLELKHNTPSISPYYVQEQVTSFDLRPLKAEFAGQDTVYIQFGYKVEQHYTHTFTYALK
ncbi:MAG: hypothetical protein IJ154_00700 [Bacteroidales bacterium]|nr:hypothetical protein [Bacteroidales bacterium]